MTGSDELRYEILLDDAIWQAIQRLPHKAQRERVLAFMRDHLSATPRQRLANRKLKELKGAHRGYWQYDIDRSYRLIYTIDDDARVVDIEYVGAHPDWGKKSRGGRIRR